MHIQIARRQVALILVPLESHPKIRILEQVNSLADALCRGRMESFHRDRKGAKKRCISRKIQFSSVAQWRLTLCNPMDCSKPGLPVHHELPESTQTHVHWVSDAIQPSHPLSSPSLPALNLSQHQGLLKWVSSLHQVAKVLEFQLQHQSFQLTPRTDLL